MATFTWPGGLDPFAGLRYLQRELDRFAGRGTGESRRVGGGNYPPINVYSSPDKIVVQCEVPGVSAGSLDLSITGETLVLKGEKAPTAEEDDVRYQRRERGLGAFQRTVVLPDAVDPDRIDAKLDAGVLTVTLPKSESAKPRQIPVK